MWYPKSKCYLVYNGVAANRFESLPSKEEARRALGLPQSCVIVTTVARLVPQKSHAFYLKPRRKLLLSLKMCVSFWWEMAVFVHNLKQRASALGLAEHVFFLGQRTDMPQILAASDNICFAFTLGRFLDWSWWKRD